MKAMHFFLILKTVTAVFAGKHPRLDDNPETFLGVKSSAACPIEMEPIGDCNYGEDCTYQVNLPPVTIHLPNQFKLIEETIKQVQELQETVQKLSLECKHQADDPKPNSQSPEETNTVESINKLQENYKKLTETTNEFKDKMKDVDNKVENLSSTVNSLTSKCSRNCPDEQLHASTTTVVSSIKTEENTHDVAEITESTTTVVSSIKKEENTPDVAEITESTTAEVTEDFIEDLLPTDTSSNQGTQQGTTTAVSSSKTEENTHDVAEITESTTAEVTEDFTEDLLPTDTPSNQGTQQGGATGTTITATTINIRGETTNSEAVRPDSELNKAGTATEAPKTSTESIKATKPVKSDTQKDTTAAATVFTKESFKTLEASKQHLKTETTINGIKPTTESFTISNENDKKRKRDPATSTPKHFTKDYPTTRPKKTLQTETSTKIPKVTDNATSFSERKGNTAIPKSIKDCSSYYKQGERISGVYPVIPDSRSGPFKVYCDMETEGGGWTVFQVRKDGTVNFNTTWDQYKKGFGSLNGEFWLGNDHIHNLTKATEMGLRIELQDFHGVKKYAEYKQFYVANEFLRYRLTIGDYSGTAGDAMRYSKKYNHDQRYFTTRDRDNDRYPSGNCGAYYSSGWWFDACMSANLNGKFYKTRYTGVRNGIFWGTWSTLQEENLHGYRESFKFVRMMLKPSALMS